MVLHHAQSKPKSDCSITATHVATSTMIHSPRWCGLRMLRAVAKLGYVMKVRCQIICEALFVCRVHSELGSRNRLVKFLPTLEGQIG